MAFLRRIFLPLWLLLALAASQVPAQIPNASFEAMEDERLADWRTHDWAGRAGFAVSDIAHDGAHSILVEAGAAGCDSAWYAPVSLRPHARYRLTGWIRTRGVEPLDGLGALFNLHGRVERSEPVTGDRDWTQVGFEFETGWETSVQVNCLVGYHGQARGRAWFDDLKLELLEERAVEIAGIHIEATKRGEHISPYIYGQFIEHLGRCIYGGVWAEMLEDRKFHFPITPNCQPWDETNAWHLIASPWRLLGADDGVRMRAENAWAEWPIPELAAGAGIEQLDLALQEGREYVGRVVFGAGPNDGSLRISLRWANDGPNASTTARLTGGDSRSGFETHAFRFRSAGDTPNGALRLVNTGDAPLQIAAVSLMPADNLQGFRRDTLTLLRQLDAPIYRWPGGNFVSGYEWRDGIGDPDQRPTYANPAWTGIETNDVGLHEFIDLCRLIDTEPMIAVNAGFGDAWSAKEQVEYANGSTATHMGAWRAANDATEPFRVRWWCIGNEMYGNWQLGHMSLDHFARKHNDFARRMRQADPTIKLIGVGAVGEWTEGMLRQGPDTMDAISEHFYVGGDANNPGNVIAHSRQPVAQIRSKAEAHRRYRDSIPGLAERDIRIAMDEWNYWYGPHVYGELGTRYFLKDALGIAAGLHEYFRQSDIYLMANYAQTVNVIGAIKTTKTDAAFATTGQVLKLYRRHFGEIPLATSPSEPVDVQAALTADGTWLTVGVVNPLNERLQLPLRIDGVTLTGAGVRYLLSGPDAMAYNEPGRPLRVTVTETVLTDVSELIAPPLSVTIYRLELAD